MNRSAFWIPLIAMLFLAGGLSAALMHSAGNPEAVATPLAGEAAPDLSVPLLDTNGKYLTSADLKGKPHLLNFFASWCGPCAGENPILMNLAKKHKVDIIGIALKDNPQPLVQYLAKRGNPYDVIGMDSDGHTGIDWGVTGIPETFAIDANGRILSRFTGGLTDDDANHLVQLLQQPAK